MATQFPMAAVLCCAGLLASFSALAQAPAGAPAIKRTEISRGDVSVPGREAIVMKVELAPGAHPGRHYHPGDEVTYITEGEGTLLVDGQPPRHYKPGEVFIVKQGTVHDLRNDGKDNLRVFSVYVLEKGKPFATPVK
jgi:quercetin dioxygenase-like cupin family protein